MLSLGYNQLSLGNVFLQKCTGGTIIFKETKAWPWHRWEKNLKFSDFFLYKKHFNKVNLKEISKSQNINHTTQSSLYFLACFGYGIWWNKFWYMMLYVVPLSQKKFLQCRRYQGWFQHPSSWKPQAQLEKNWDPAFTLWSPVKNEHFRSMFVTCAFPGL